MVGPTIGGIQTKKQKILWKAMTRSVMALLLLAGLGGCRPRVLVRQAPAAPMAISKLAVYPVLFRFPVSPHQSFQRGRALAERLSVETALPVYGPGEFRVELPDEDLLSRGTNLGEVLGSGGARSLEGVAGLRVTVARRVTQGESEISGRRRRTSEQTEVVVRAELLSGAERRVVLELEGLATVDPFADALGVDPFPEVTHLTDEMVGMLVRRAGFPAGASRAPGLVTVPVPRPATVFFLGVQRSLESEWSALDALDQDGRWSQLVTTLLPGATPEEERLLRRAPHGLFVRKGGLGDVVPGDLLVQADGEPLLGRQTLERHLAQGRSRITVRGRQGDRVIEWSSGSH